MKLRLRAAAADDLDGVFDYSVAVHGPGLAERYMRDVQAGMDRLLDFPKLGVETGLRPGVRAFGVREHHLYYVVEGDELLVVRVLHKAMDASRHL